MSEIFIRFLIGGFFVSAFVLAGGLFKPTSFGGLFGPARSLALATRALAISKDGKSYASNKYRSMIAGAVGLCLYGLLVSQLPFVLEEKHKWLRNIALNRLDVPGDFWKKMDALPVSRTDIPPGARKAIESLLPDPKLAYRVVRREAGVGSLGHPRYVAIADRQGGQIALEAKAATPSACLWARPAASSQLYYQLALDQAIRCPDPFVRLSGKWLVRPLVPDSSPIEIETMPGLKDQDKLLHAMAWEAANVHLEAPRAAARIAADLTVAPASGCGRPSRIWRGRLLAIGKHGKNRGPEFHRHDSLRASAETMPPQYVPARRPATERSYS